MECRVWGGVIGVGCAGMGLTSLAAQAQEQGSGAVVAAGTMPVVVPGAGEVLAWGLMLITLLCVGGLVLLIRRQPRIPERRERTVADRAAAQSRVAPRRRQRPGRAVARTAERAMP